jgi:hypothetical protein
VPIKQIKRIPGQPPPPEPPTPQCESNVQDFGERELSWRMQRYGAEKATAFRCIRTSVVQIDGKHYCRLHGGHIVLDKYIRGEIVDAPKDNNNSGAKAATETTGG